MIMCESHMSHGATDLLLAEQQLNERPRPMLLPACALCYEEAQAPG